MDISALKPIEQTLEILHPGKGSPLGIRVSLVSIDDDELKSLRRQIQDAANKARVKGKPLSAKETDANESEICFKAMSGWDWYQPEIEPAKMEGDKVVKAAVLGEQPSWKGDKNPPFNRKTVLEIFDALPWFRDQVTEKVGDTKSFFPD